jgi:hypothetical protein
MLWEPQSLTYKIEFKDLLVKTRAWRVKSGKYRKI